MKNIALISILALATVPTFAQSNEYRRAPQQFGRPPQGQRNAPPSHNPRPQPARGNRPEPGRSNRPEPGHGSSGYGRNTPGGHNFRPEAPSRSGRPGTSGRR
jgi:hypothetical protein